MVTPELYALARSLYETQTQGKVPFGNLNRGFQLRLIEQAQALSEALDKRGFSVVPKP